MKFWLPSSKISKCGGSPTEVDALRVTFKEEEQALAALRDKGVRLFGLWCRMDGGPPTTIVHLFDYPYEDPAEDVSGGDSSGAPANGGAQVVPPVGGLNSSGAPANGGAQVVLPGGGLNSSGAPANGGGSSGDQNSPSAPANGGGSSGVQISSGTPANGGA